MSLAQSITQDLKKAIKSKDELRVSCLRMLKASIKNKEVEMGHPLKDEEIQSIISSSIRKSKEAASEFVKGDRHDLAAKEEDEIKILYAYLPEQLTPAEIEKTLKEIIAELSASSVKEMGKVMKIAMSRFAGKAQGKEVSEIAKKILSG